MGAWVFYAPDQKVLPSCGRLASMRFRQVIPVVHVF